MPWIESHTVLGRHRKVLLTAHDLAIDIPLLVGHLSLFWHAVLEQQEDGDLTDWPDTMIESAAMWKGESGKFATILRSRGWIDGHLVHDWIDYTGPFLTKKYSTGNVERLREIWGKHGYKYGKGQGKYAKHKASGKRVGSERKARLPFPSSPSPSLPDLSKPNQPNLSEEESPQAQVVKRLEAFTLTPELEAWAAKEGILNPAQYVEEFKDYWRSCGCRRKNGQFVKDWAAAFRNRLRALQDQGKLKKSTRDVFEEFAQQGGGS